MIQKMVLYGPLSFDLTDHPPLKQHITAVMRPLGVGGVKKHLSKQIRNVRIEQIRNVRFLFF